ncbi:DNRLRE domain-containing protein [Actinopolymorpha sp. B17G11]|uniref:CBM96 family carbohydrate-binding protein n=1 Tax=Actinopolymorpha sp. B17G11 TaxID=3160861 RepID=UPI0032E4BEB7
MYRRTFVKGSLAALTSMAGFGVTLLNPTVPVSASSSGVGPVVSGHPRLMLRDFDGVKATIQGSERAAGWYARVKADADAILTAPVSEYAIPDGLRLLGTSRTVVRRAYSLALAYAVENKQVYAERLWEEMHAVANFPDWNSQRHFLDTAEMAHAVAIAYDWLYHAWTEARRTAMQTAIRELGLKPGLAVYTGNPPSGTAFPNWHRSTSNWNIVCNAGLSIGALAIAEHEPELSQRILDEALASIPLAVAAYGPHGGYPEGVGSYWGYATKYLVPYIESLITATGDDYGLSTSPGLADTGLFPIYLTGPTGMNFNYYDAGSGSPQPPEMFWLAKRYDNPVYGWWGGIGADKNAISWFQSPASLLWFDPSKVRAPIEAQLPLDRYFGRSEAVTMRSGWEDTNAIFAAFKAGENSAGHADLDLGDFVFDAIGVRWAIELGSDDYNLPGYFTGGPGGQRWTYYRKRAEGQNTLVINPSRGDDQQVRGTGVIIEHKSGPKAAYAIAELTKAHPALRSWRRGVQLHDNRQQLLVQDEFATEDSGEAWWFMHTSAAIAISSDGRSATLELGDRRVLARISSPASAVFYNAPAKPLWTSPDPDRQTDNLGVRKLAIRLNDVETATVAVQLSPLRSGQKAPELTGVTPLSEWTTGPETVSGLRTLSVNGATIPSFSSATFVYTVDVASGESVPVVSAEAADSAGRVVVHQARSVPGFATVESTEAGKARARYEVYFIPKLGPGLFPSTIIASSHDGNVPENTMDGDLTTRWSAEGDGQWIAYDMGADGPVSSVKIAWYLGDQRSSSFDVEVAAAEGDWHHVFSGWSSGNQTSLETYSFDNTTAQYVRIVGHGNTASSWNSITEVEIPGRTVQPPAIEPHLAAVTLEAPESLALNTSTQLDITATMNDGTTADLSNATISYDTDDPTVATVTATGELMAVAEGKVSVAGIVLTEDWRLEYGRKTVTVIDPNSRRFTPVADTYVNDGAKADTNYGAATTLLVKTVQWMNSGVNREAYFRFEPDSVDGTVESITLNLHANVYDNDGDEIDVDVHVLAGTFEENAVTWNTRPALGEKLGTAHITRTAGWYSVDLTESLRSAVASGGAISLAAVERPPAGENGLVVNIRSRESDEPPYLNVRVA